MKFIKVKITCLLSILLVVFAVSSCRKQNLSNYDEAWAKVPEILSKIVPPAFPESEFDVLEFGANPNPEIDNRYAIQAAIDSCTANGGGKVVIPEGEYLLNGPLHLKSNVNLHLKENAVIYFGYNPDDYLPTVEVRWEGTRCYNYSPFIYAFEQKNIAITGKGTIDGQQDKFWILWKLIQDDDKNKLRSMGSKLVPLEERIFGKGHFLRPTLIEPYKSENILIEGVTVKNSPFWTIHPVFCKNVTIRNVNIRPGQSNDDGCNPESSEYVLIENCNFYTNDDNIAIKSGRDQDAWIENGGKPSENIIIRNNTFHKSDAGAISIGSEMSGGVRNVFAENNIVKNVGRVFYLKSNTDRGGIIENIFYRNTAIDSCGEVARIQLDYKGANVGPYPADFNNIYIENVSCNYAALGIRILGLPYKSIEKVSLINFDIQKVKRPSEIFFVNDLKLINYNYNSVTAIDDEYFEKSKGGEEDPNRIYWGNLNPLIQKTFLKILHHEIDKIENVSENAKLEVKDAFEKNPMINEIKLIERNGNKLYHLRKYFGWETIEAIITVEGKVLNQ